MYTMRFVAILLLLLVVTVAVSGDSEVSTPSGTPDDEKEGEKVTSAKKKVKKSTKDWNKINFNDLEKQWEDGDEDEEREYEFEHSEKIMKRKAREAKQEKAKAKKAAAKNKKKESKPSSKPSKGKSGGGKGKKSAGPEGDGDWVPPPPGFENIDMSQTIGPGGRGGPGGPGGGMPPGLEGFDMNNMDIGATGLTEKDMGPQMWFVDISMQQEQGPDKGKRWNRSALDKLAAYWGEMMRTAHLSAKMYVLGEYKNDPETKEETGPTMLVSLDKAWQQRDITKYIATQPEVLKMTKDRKTITRFNFQEDDDDEL